MGCGIEFGGNFEWPVKRTDKNKPLQQRYISDLNEAYQLSLSQQTHQKNVVTDNQKQSTTKNCSRLELGQANTGACMNEEIHAMQQLENTDPNKEREQLMSEIKYQRKIIEDIKNESEDIISQVLQESENLKSKIQRMKRENNDCVDKDIHHLQQKISK